MKALLISAVELCLLRRAPQDLPSSIVFLQLMIILNLLVGMLMVVDARYGIIRSTLENLFGLVLMLAVTYIALRLRGKLLRFVQTATAMLLSSLLLSLLALPLVAWGHHSESAESQLLLLVLFVWSIVVLGHIIRHAFELTLNVGIAAALLYNILAWYLMSLFFPVLA